MKKQKMKSILLPLLALFIFTLTTPAKAATFDAFIDAPSSTAVGSDFAVTVSFEADAKIMVQAELSYDSSAVTFLRSSDDDSINDVGGKILIVPMNSSTSFTFTFYFKMNQEAAVNFNLQVLESYSLEEVPYGTPYAGATVRGVFPTPVPVTPAPTEKPTPTPTPFIPTIDPSATPATPLEFRDNSGEMRFIAENFDDGIVPEGFTKFAYEFKTFNIFAIKNEYNVIMLYATDVLGQNGRFYIYDSKNDTMAPFVSYIIGGNTYTFLTPADPLPEGFVLKPVTIGDVANVSAYQIPGDQYKEFLLVYAFNKTAAPSFYLFDTIEGTMQRCTDINLLGTSIVPTGSSSPSPTPKSTPGTTYLPKADIGTGRFSNHTLLIIIIALCFVAAVTAIIVIMVRNHKINSRYDEIDDDTDEMPEPPNPDLPAPEDLEEPEEPQAPEEQTGTEETEPESGEVDQPRQDAEKTVRYMIDDNDDDLHLNNHFPR